MYMHILNIIITLDRSGVGGWDLFGPTDVSLYDSSASELSCFDSLRLFFILIFGKLIFLLVSYSRFFGYMSLLFSRCVL